MSDTGYWVWRKSSVSEGNGNSDCVEVAHVTEAVGVRDAKDRAAGALAFTLQAWTTFVHGLHNR